MGRVVDYKLVTRGPDGRRFEEEVRALLKQGWEPLGPPVVETKMIAPGTQVISEFVQAMILVVPDSLAPPVTTGRDGARPRRV